MAHVVDTTYGRNRDLGQVTDPALLDYYRSQGYTIDGTVNAPPPGAPAQTVLGLQVPYGATDGEVVTVQGGGFITAPAAGGGGGGGAVASVNGHTGAVVLSASDVGATTTTYVDGKIAALVGAAPTALDTLKEIDDQLAADEGSAAALAATVAGKALKGHVVTKTANYTAVLGDVVLADTTAGTFAVTIPAASGGAGRIVVKWVAGTVAPTINLTGTDHVNTSSGVQTFTPTLLGQGYQLESDGVGLWAVTSDDLPLSKLDARYAPAGSYVAASPAPSAWQASHAYSVGQTFTQGGTTYVVSTAYTSDASFGATDTGNTFVLGSGSSVSLAEKSAWATATAYAVGDAVNQNGYRYLCKTAHTSGTFATDKTAGKWTLTGLAVDDTTAPSAGQSATYSSTSSKFAPTSGVKLNLAASTYNVSPSSLRRARAAAARAAAGGNTLHIACAGDSTTYGNPGPASFTGTWPQMLAAALQSHGATSRGTGMLSASFATRSGSPMTTTGVNGYAAGIGQTAQYLAGGSSNTLTFTANTDQFRVMYHKRSSSGGTVTATVDGSAVASFDCSGTGGTSIQFITYNVTQGSHTLVLTAPASGNGFILGVEARANGATGSSKVSVFAQGGLNSSQLADGTSEAPASSLQSITALAADLLIVDFGINDYIGGGSLGGVQTSPATYYTNLHNVITTQRAAGGDVLLVGWPPNGGAAGSGGNTQAQYIQQLYALCDADDVAMIDLQARWTSYAISSVAPISYYADSTHPNANGHADQANAIYAALASVGVGV